MSIPTLAVTDFDPAVCLARQSLYRFAALSLLDPRAQAWQQLNALRGDDTLAAAAALLRGLPQAVPAELGLGERPLTYLDPQRVLRRLPRRPGTLNAQYERTFGLLAGTACPPYETEYIDGKFAFRRSNTLADVSGFYRAFGLTPSAAHPERPDHVVLELEFMAFLLDRQRQAAGDEQREVCHAAQRRFFGEHLAWWLPALGRLLGRENRGGFYAAAGRFLAALVPAERAILKVSAADQPAAPSSPERPEACEGCQLA